MFTPRVSWISERGNDSWRNIPRTIYTKVIYFVAKMWKTIKINDQ